MNVMAQAHKDCKARIAAGNPNRYADLFRVALRQAHKEYKAMQNDPVALLKADTIAKFEKRIDELQIILATPVAQKFMVVCGDDHPMPVDFETADPKWPWASVETATKWNSVQFARSNASKVVNGHKQVGKAVKVADHIEWDIDNLQKLVKALKE